MANSITLVSSDSYGTDYEFAIDDASAPTIGGMKVLKIEETYGTSVDEESQNGEGMTDSAVQTKAARRRIMHTMTGVISNLSTFRTGTASYTFNGRFFRVKSQGVTRQQKYAEGTVSAVSDYLITS